MKLNKILIFIILVGVNLSCKKESPIPLPEEVEIENDFIFYPTKDAKWILKSNHITPVGTFNFLDTVFIGKDTVMLSMTENDLNTFEFNTYIEMIIHSATISPSLDTSIIKGRHGWFRQDIKEEKIYTPYLQPNGVINDYLRLDFKVKLGDTIGYYSYNFPYVVKEIDSLSFSNRYLTQIMYGPGGQSTSIFDTLTQAVDFRVNGVSIYSGIYHPGIEEWRKFIYRTDTLFVKR
ncbi:hypothetical protein ACFLQ5_01390 [Bacteroidota bacterium]